MARQRADGVIAKLARGVQPDRYLYGDRPMREPILGQWQRQDGQVWAAITRNVYGCQILNTASVMFVDVDLPRLGGWSWVGSVLKRLLGRADPTREEQWRAGALARARELVDSDSRWGLRAYRTRAGLRYLLTHDHFDPGAESTLGIMNALGADPLYVRLCRAQECFRARLDAKPWRCGLHPLRVRYPWPDEESEQQMLAWVAAHEEKSRSYAACELIGHFGSRAMDAKIGRVVDFHDRATRALSGLELA